MILRRYITILIVLLIGTIGILYHNYKIQKVNSLRNEENIRQSMYADSLKKAIYIYSDKQLKEYIATHPQITKIIKESSIKPARVTNITTQDYKYRDTVTKIIKVPYIPESLKNTPFTDSTNCLVIKGILELNKDSVGVKILSREFSNSTTVIGYWERRQWRFLGMKTRILGRKQPTVRVVDECGESKIIEIHKKE